MTVLLRAEGKSFWLPVPSGKGLTALVTGTGEGSARSLAE